MQTLRDLHISQFSTITRVGSLKTRRHFCMKHKKDINVFSPSEIVVIITKECTEKKLSTNLVKCEIMSTHHFLEHCRGLDPTNFKPLFHSLLKILYRDDKNQERDRQTRGYKQTTADGMLNIMNRILKLTTDGVLTDSQVQFL